jgi:hypothetical protein
MTRRGCSGASSRSAAQSRSGRGQSSSQRSGIALRGLLPDPIGTAPLILLVLDLGRPIAPGPLIAGGGVR